MALIDELRTRWNTRHAEFTRLEATVDEMCDELRDLEVTIAALSDPEIAAAALSGIAIAALTPQDAPITAAVAEPEIPESEPVEFISDLTGNPAIEPETGLHGDPVLRAFEDDQIIAPAWIDEQTCEPINPHVEAEGYAPVVAADEPDPEPSLLDRFNPFRVKADA